MNEGLFKHVIAQSHSQYQELRVEIKEIHGKIDKLSEFKIRMLTHTWWISIITSSVCGLATLFVTAYFTHKLEGK